MLRKFTTLMAVVLTLAFIFSGVATTRATLGPIHVELNTTGDRPSGVRAGQVTAFKIHMRFNINVKVHDWIKIWFPIDEASCDPKDICDGLPEVNGSKEHPRFVPNDKYFEKYPGNTDEAKHGKLYEVLDDRKGATRFDKVECKDGNCASEGKCRIIAEKNGLGGYMLGTVLPQLPKDESDRWHRLAMIIRSTSIGYTPCTECQGLPFLTNTAKERSYQVNSPLEVDAWRKGYNPIDINTSKATGFIAPATPGRYKLYIATAPEPTPVESETFVLPCSRITDPIITLKPSDTDTEADFTIKFKTGEGGALDADTSNIMIQFPPDYVLPSSIKPKMITVNGTPLNKNPQIVKSSNQITLTSPAAVNNTSDITIRFLEKAMIKNPAKIGEYQIKVRTDAEPEVVDSKPFKVETVPSVNVVPNIEQTIAEYYAVGLTTDGIKKGTDVTINFPKGTVIPKTIKPESVEVNKKPYVGTVISGDTTITIQTPFDINGAFKIKFLASAGIINTTPGNYTLTYTVGGKNFSFEKYDIIKSIPQIEATDVTVETGCEASAYKFKYIPSKTGELAAGDTITVEFPEGTMLPRSIAPETVKINTSTAKAVSVEDMKVEITLAAEVKSNTGANIEFTSASGIMNPRYPGSYKLIVSSSKDEATESPSYTITQPKLSSKLVFKEPGEPDGLEFEGCHWFKTPPILSFESCNPFAEITFWFDNKENASIVYTGEKKMSPGSSRSVIRYYSKVGDAKEEPKSVTICLDTIPPSFAITEPASDTVVTNKPTYIVRGERQPTEMLTWGDNEKYQVVDGLYVDGTQIFSPEIFETLSRDSIKMKFEHKIDLKPGKNTVEFKGIDQAGNERVVTKTIFYDNIKPNIEFISPKPGETLEAKTDIGIKIATENDASVFIDGQIANLIETRPDGKTAEFEIDWTVVEGENKVKIEVTDLAGNTNTVELKFIGKKKQTSTIIELWLGKTDWVVNGTKQTPLKAAPVNTAPPLPKEFAGSTFMPIKEVADALKVGVGWDPKTKMVTLTQTLPNGSKTIIELWINNKTAKVNGKATPIDSKGKLYPAIIGGKTMLPLRFVGDNLNCGIQYDSATKKITLTYPKP